MKFLRDRLDPLFDKLTLPIVEDQAKAFHRVFSMNLARRGAYEKFLASEKRPERVFLSKCPVSSFLHKEVKEELREMFEFRSRLGREEKNIFF